LLKPGGTPGKKPRDSQDGIQPVAQNPFHLLAPLFDQAGWLSGISESLQDSLQLYQRKKQRYFKKVSCETMAWPTTAPLAFDMRAFSPANRRPPGTSLSRRYLLAARNRGVALNAGKTGHRQ